MQLLIMQCVRSESAICPSFRFIEHTRKLFLLLALSEFGAWIITCKLILKKCHLSEEEGIGRKVIRGRIDTPEVPPLQ